MPANPEAFQRSVARAIDREAERVRQLQSNSAAVYSGKLEAVAGYVSALNPADDRLITLAATTDARTGSNLYEPSNREREILASVRSSDDAPERVFERLVTASAEAA